MVRTSGYRHTTLFLFLDWYLTLPKEAFEGDQKGGEMVGWYHQLFEKSTTFASILASVMFSAMILDLRASTPPHGKEGEVRIWSAIGAILFVLLVLLCQGLSLVLKFHGREIARAYDAKDFGVRLVLSQVSLGFQGLLLTGTLFFCLVVKAYVPAAGWTAFGITAALLLICWLLWVRQFWIELWSQAHKGSRSYGPASVVEDVEVAEVVRAPT